MPRLLFSSSLMIWQARSFGRTREGSLPEALTCYGVQRTLIVSEARPFTVEPMCMTWEYRSDRTYIFPPPPFRIRQSSPRSFLPRSTSMLCSARSFSSASSSALQLLILLFVAAASGPCARPAGRCLTSPIVHPDQRLRGSAGNLQIVAAKIKHIRRRICSPQHRGRCPEGCPQSAASSRLDSTKLKNVSLPDVVLYLFNLSAELFFRKTGTEFFQDTSRL